MLHASQQYSSSGRSCLVRCSIRGAANRHSVVAQATAAELPRNPDAGKLAVARARVRAILSQPLQRRQLNLQPFGRGDINWERWEGLTYERYLAALADAPDEAEVDDSEEAGTSQAAAATSSGQQQQQDAADRAGSSVGSSSSQSAAEVERLLNAAFFSRYDDPRAHEALLRDKALTSAYRAAVAGAVEGRVVLDVGCGLGVLSMLCAEAGASHVYAVEASEAAAAIAVKVIAANGLGDRVTVLVGRMQDVELPESVDVVVSNWMGSALFGGAMLPAVLSARDRWLRPQEAGGGSGGTAGRVLPGVARLMVTGVEDAARLLGRKEEWDKVQGFSMGAALPQLIKHPHRESLVRESQLMTDTVVLREVDLATAAAASCLTFTAPFALCAKRDERLYGLLLHFDLLFPAAPGGAPAESSSSTPAPAATAAEDFSTGPSAPPTHFEQLVLNFPRAIGMSQGDTVTGSVTMRPAGAASRELLMDVEVNFKGMVARVAYVVAP